METNNSLVAIVKETKKVLAPLIVIAKINPPHGFLMLCEKIGIGLNQALSDIDQLTPILDQLVRTHEQLESLDLNEQTFSEATSLIKNIIHIIENSKNLNFKNNTSDEIKLFGKRLLEHLIHEYLYYFKQPLYQLLTFVGAIEHEKINSRPLFDFIKEPINQIQDYYHWNTNEFNPHLLLSNLYSLLKVFGIKVYFKSPEPFQLTLTDYREDAEFLDQELRIPVVEFMNNGLFIESGFSIFSKTYDEAQKSNLNLFFFGTSNLQHSFSIGTSWRLQFISNLESIDDLGIVINPDNIEVKKIGNNTIPNLEVKSRIERTQTNAEKLPLLDIAGCRLETGPIGLGLKLSFSDSRPEAVVDLLLHDLYFLLDFSKANSFLAKVFSNISGKSTAFSAELAFSSIHGLYFETTKKLQVDLPSSLNFGMTQLNNIAIDINLNVEKTSILVGLDLKSKLGPFSLSVSNLGLSAKLEFYGLGDNITNGNLGPLDADFSIKPPTGVGLVIQSTKISGGGYLSRQDTRYTGVLQLNFNKKINLTAIGILDTELPDGQEGYSLLILITVEGFKPIPLGLGFKLKGVGGLLALNRSMSLDVLRTGIKDKTLNNILFPKISVEKMNNGGEMEFDGAELISSLDRAFPQAEGRFVFGPMAKLEWGSGKALFELDIGLFIEVSEPLLGIAGALRTLLPDENSRKLYIQVNFLGAVDLGAKTISFDASLFASRLLNITLSGDMAVRMAYGKHPNFLLSVGGFHPRYTPPPMDLKPMRRIAITILDEEKARVFIQSYFAVTSNTVQVGARAEAWFQALSYDIEGVVGFDLLFQFNPFRFFFDAELNFTVKKEGEEKMSVYVAFYLEGPGVWIVRGTATFEILGVAIPLDFDKTFGQSTLEADLKNVDIKKLFTEELEKPENWAAILPKSFDLVNIKVDESTTELVFHPAGRLAINQRILPLNTNLQRFGHSLPNATRFEISKISFGEDSMESEFLQEHFAPTEFFELSNEEKLSRPSFEKRDSGIIAGNQDTSVGMGSMLTQEVSHERILIDLPDQSRKTVSIPNFHPFATGASVSQSPWSSRRRGGSRQRQPFIRRREPAYQVVHAETLQPFASRHLYSTAGQG
jgi:hypothetical protein